MSPDLLCFECQVCIVMTFLGVGGGGGGDDVEQSDWAPLLVSYT